MAAEGAPQRQHHLARTLPDSTAVLTMSVSPSVQYLGQREAQRLDEQLMSRRFGFSIDQLMELAGLSVACAVGKAFPSDQLTVGASADVQSVRRVLVVAGPGNNG